MFAYLLLRCSAREGVGVHGVFDSEMGAKAAFGALALAEMEMVEAFIEAQTGQKPGADLETIYAGTLMSLDWDQEEGRPSEGWTVRKIPVNKLFTADVGLRAP